MVAAWWKTLSRKSETRPAWSSADARQIGGHSVICPDVNLVGANFPVATTADVLNLDALVAGVSPAAEIAADARHLAASLMSASKAPCLPRPRDRNPPAS